MQFNQGARVLTLDGKEAGHIDRVVIDPRTNEVTHLMVRRGLLQRQDKVIPISVVTTGPNEVLSVHVRSDDLELLPDYQEEQYVQADKAGEGDNPSAVYLYPPYPGGVPGIATYSPAYVAKTHLNIPVAAVALKEGAKVIARDKKEVGHIAQVLMSTPADQVTHFLITKGFLVKENRLIPVGWVDRLAENEVHLAIDSNIVERLPVVEAV
jgi:uncharacterized protein YrrD